MERSAFIAITLCVWSSKSRVFTEVVNVATKRRQRKLHTDGYGRQMEQNLEGKLARNPGRHPRSLHPDRENEEVQQGEHREHAKGGPIVMLDRRGAFVWSIL